LCSRRAEQQQTENSNERAAFHTYLRRTRAADARVAASRGRKRRAEDCADEQQLSPREMHRCVHIPIAPLSGLSTSCRRRKHRRNNRYRRRTTPAQP
jgi:hypothetical protein